MRDLKKCPFCGDVADCDFESADGDMLTPIGPIVWYVFCKTCKCSTPPTDTLEEAITIWNKRVKKKH